MKRLGPIILGLTVLGILMIWKGGGFSDGGGGQTTTNSVTNTTNDTPSNAEVIASIKAAWAAEDNQKLADLKDKLQTAESKHAECTGTIAKQCVFISGGTRGPGWLHLNPQVWNGYDDFVYDTQDACINDATARICNTKEILGDIELQKTDIASCEYRADYFIFVAIKTHNYEGNIISYVDLRKQKEEVIEQYKVSFKRQDNALVLLSMDTYSQ